MSDNDRDPVVNSSLSKPLFIASMALTVAMGWALYDEVYGIRPWKSYQTRFRKTYARFLKEARPNEAATEKQIRASGEYRKLDEAMAAAEKAVAAKAGSIDKEINESLVPQILALNEPFQEVRSHIGELDLPDRDQPQRKPQAEAARRDRGTQERGPHGQAAQPGRHHAQSLVCVRPDGPRPAGVEGPQGKAAAGARGTAEAGHGAARRTG